MINNIRYSLTSKSLGKRYLKDDPKGWDEDSRALERKIGDFMLGVVYDFAGALEFVGDGLEYIDTVELLEGFEADVILIKEVRNFQDRWVTAYQGKLDLLSKNRTRKGYEVEVINSGLAEDFKNVYSDKYELSRTTSVDGLDIGTLQHDRMLINGREIEVRSELNAEDNLTIAGFMVEVAQGVFRADQIYVPKLTKTFSGDEAVQSAFSTPEVINNDAGNNFPNSESYFFLLNATESEQRRIKVNIDSSLYVANNLLATNEAGFALFRYHLEDNGTYTFVQSYLIVVNDSINPNNTVELNADNVILDVNVNRGDCLFLRFFCNATALGEQLLWELQQTSIKIEMQYGSSYPQTPCDGLTVLNTLKRLSLINFGHDRVKSNFLENGDFKDLCITSGKKLRQFPDSIECSFKQVIESLRPTVNLFYGSENINNLDYLVVEPFEYFFKPSLLADIGKVDNVSQKYIPNVIYSGFKIGYSGDYEYEEQQGLDEYNVNNSFTYNLKKVDTEANYLSEIRADSFGIEITRRKPKRDFPELDTKYDNKLFFVDCKAFPKRVYVGNPPVFVEEYTVYINRPWQFDFDSAPIGIFSPDTAYNLRLSPKNNLFRISNSFTGIAAYPDKTTVFKSGERNSDLSTTLIDGVARVERDNVLNLDLSKPLIKPIEISFSKKLTDDELNSLIGLDNDVPNYYKLITFIDDENTKQYGYLLSYDPKDEGTMILIKANI